MSKSISWFALWKRLGKQPLNVTRNRKAELLIDGCRYELALVYEDNGNKFHLEPTKIIKELR